MNARPDLSTLSVAQKDALIVALFDQVEELLATVQMLKSCVEELEGNTIAATFRKRSSHLCNTGRS